MSHLTERESDPVQRPPQQREAQAGQIYTKALHYDPVAIAAKYRGQWLKVWGRCLAVLWPVLFFAFQLWLDRRWGSVERNELKRAAQLRELLTNLGPAFIKIGQALSTRPDLVPPLYLEELTKLQDEIPPFSNKIAFRFIREELGASPDAIYAELSETPIAAASLGQVYKGKLQTGETVAVKVQRPGLAESITLDIYILRQLAAWAMTNVKRIRSDLVAITDEFGDRIFDEMDYTQEGRNAERFAELYGYIDEIYIPRIYWQYTNRRVLTMEWVTGTKLTKLEDISQQGIDAAHLIEVGVQCSLRQLLEHGFFHADPHPGNLLAMPDGRLAYLDFGMMSEVKPYQRYGLIEAVVHLVNRDFDGLAQDYIQLEFLSPDTDLTPIIPALAKVFNNALGASVAELNFKSITDQLSALMYEYPFQVPAYYALIIRSLVTLEGIAINVDPEFKVLSRAYPYISKRLLTDPAPELRRSLRELLFKDGGFRWNRLENLLRNARNSNDYELDHVIEQSVDFLFSERGSFIRARLVQEITNGLDRAGQNTLQQIRQRLQELAQSESEAAHTPDGRLASPSHKSPYNSQPNAPSTETWERLQNIGKILQETNGFDPLKLAALVPDILAKPELHKMGQQVLGNLAQRTAARLLRNVLVTEQAPAALQTSYRE
ncbi:MAG: AarF/ABC1/UbiB kinase family protein [Cyanobacteria bacterium P01_H01_bin.121]